MLIYQIKHIASGKRYIGQTTRKLADRISDYNDDIKLFKKGANRYKSKIVAALAKYDWTSFELTIIQDNIDNQDSLNHSECFWITYFDTISNGYNIREGGSIGRHSEETKRLISEANKNPSEELRELRRQANLGKKATEETKMKMSISRSGIPMPESTKEAISLANTCSKRSEESKAKMSKAQTGNQNRKGTYVSKESMAKAWATRRAKKAKELENASS
jgi:group I intron endonuclease